MADLFTDYLPHHEHDKNFKSWYDSDFGDLHTKENQLQSKSKKCFVCKSFTLCKKLGEMHTMTKELEKK